MATLSASDVVTDHAAYAEKRPELRRRIKEAFVAALAADRPVLVECHTDPEVPPLPPHITLQQAMHFMSTLAKGDQREGNMIVGAARQVIGSILPGHGDS